MKKLVPILLLVIHTAVFGKVIKGYITFSDGTTKKVNIHVPYANKGKIKFETMQYSIKYSESDGKVKILRPKDALEYGFTSLKGEKITMRSLSAMSNALTLRPLSEKSQIYLRVIYDGMRIKVYENYFVKNQRTGMHVIYQKSQQGMFNPTIQNFIVEMAEYFSDCPGLVDVLKKGKLNRKQGKEIGELYEKCK